MKVHQVLPEEDIVDALEECLQTMSVRKIWVLTYETDDVQSIRTALINRDYTVVRGACPSVQFMEGFQNTLVTDWDTYAADQDVFIEILSSLDVIVLDGMSELDVGSWFRWVEKSKDRGYHLSPSIVLITA